MVLQMAFFQKREEACQVYENHEQKEGDHYGDGSHHAVEGQHLHRTCEKMDPKRTSLKEKALSFPCMKETEVFGPESLD